MRKTKCNRCHHSSREHHAGNECGKTDAWGGNPCRGIMIEVPANQDIKNSMRAAIKDMERLARIYRRGHASHTHALNVERDIDNLRYHMERL